MHIGSLRTVINENAAKKYFDKVHKYTPEGIEDKYLAKWSNGKLADKHGKHPLLGAVPGAIVGGMVGGPVGAGIGAAAGTGIQYLKRKFHKHATEK